MKALFRRLFGRGSEPPAPEWPDKEIPTPFEAPIVLDPGDTIDLHTFHPRDVPSVVSEFLETARTAGFSQVRIIHGKGIGVQRKIVRRILSKHPDVAAFHDAPNAGWGATVVQLVSRENRGG